MKVLILYRPDSEHERSVQTFIREYSHRTGKDIELVSLDTREGAGMARLHDVIEYPAVLAVEEERNSLLHMWQGERLPLIDEVSYYNQRGV